MGFNYLFFLLVILPSVVPRPATHSAVRVFPGVWKLLSLFFSVGYNFCAFLLFFKKFLLYNTVLVLPYINNFSLFKTPFLRWSSIPTSFVSLFVFYIFSYLLLKTMGCFSGCLMSSAGIQKLFCGIYSAFKCSFDEFLGEKVVSPSCSSAILGPLMVSFW